ncbi:L-lactate dehydrogenase (quinone) large subunit LdhH [uncultured Mailhella sp.]|uniref:L-lactate dehydrogenase (quinone) large subunit LdhH n=1 Tax=uncultured Mailhella sp. TaxID=1981031 RepID=UPI0025F89BBD|nr:LUD domain-containing protein [uncultured Mailhella sp.]
MADAKNMKEYHGQIQEALDDKFLRATLDKFAVEYKANRTRIFSGMDVDGLIKEVADIKDNAAQHMMELFAQFKAEAEKRGVHVHLASTGAEANRIIAKIAKENNCHNIIKSKSMTAEEIHLNDALEKEGCRVVETDLGEWIIQLRHEGPSHMVMPAIHLSRYQVADLFTDVTHVQQDREDIQKLVKVARKELRSEYVKADMGISGANFAVAEAGLIGTVTNEGNLRLVTTMPRVHVVLAGLEKLIPTIADALKVLQVLPRNATAQAITSYITWIAGANECAAGPDGRKEMHIVFLDNGRLKIAQDPAFKDILRCVRCGACANVCPVYRLIGGHKMGYVYIGAVGLALTYLYHGADKARALVQNCIGCESCKNVCSAGIDLPRITMEIRSRLVKADGNNAAGSVMSMVMKDRDRFHSLLKFIKFSQKPLTVKGGKFIRHLPAVLMGGDQSFRQLPALAPKSFRQLFKSVVNNPSQPKFRVAIFSGCAQDFVYPEQLVAAVRLLNRHGVHVEFPLKQTCCGLPLEMMGQRETSLQVSSQNVNAFEPGKYDAILTLCASCAGHLKHAYPDLLKDTPDHYRTDIFASKVMDFTSFVYNKLGLRAEDFVKSNEKVTYHSPCHMRNMGVTEEPRALLNMVADYVPATEEDMCCGFGGTFSVKFPELSAEIGKKKLKNSEDTGASLVVTDCPGCVMQIRGVATANDSPIKVEHISELLARQMK